MMLHHCEVSLEMVLKSFVRKSYVKKLFKPSNLTVDETLVLGLLTSTSLYNFGILSKNTFILLNCVVDKLSINSLVSLSLKSVLS